MSDKKRIIFTFDERSYDSLEKLKEQARFGSLAETVKESLQVTRALQQQKNQGYSEVIVRNPETKEERVLVIPNL